MVGIHYGECNISLFWKGGWCKSGHQCSQPWCSLLWLCYDVYSWGSNKVYYSPPQNRVTWKNYFCRKSEYWSSKISHYHCIVQIIETTISADVQNKFQAKNEPAGKKPTEKKENEVKKETVSERYCLKNSVYRGFAVLQFMLICQEKNHSKNFCDKKYVFLTLTTRLLLMFHV